MFIFVQDDQKPEKADARTDEQKRAETRRKFTQTEPGMFVMCLFGQYIVK